MIVCVADAFNVIVELSVTFNVDKFNTEEAEIPDVPNTPPFNAIGQEGRLSVGEAGLNRNSPLVMVNPPLKLLPLLVKVKAAAPFLTIATFFVAPSLIPRPNVWAVV